MKALAKKAQSLVSAAAGSRKFLAFFFVGMIFLGYALTGPILSGNAAISISMTSCGQACCDSGGTVPCMTPGTTSRVANQMINDLKNNLKQAAQTLEQYLDQLLDSLTKALVTQINQLEEDIMNWWSTMWWYNLLPSLQAMTEQINSAVSEQATAVSSFMDSVDQSGVITTMQRNSIEAHRLTRPHEDRCYEGATVGGGGGRSSALAGAMRRAWEREGLNPGLNRRGTASASGAIGTEAQRYKDYKNFFCDPDSNGGYINCATPAPAAYRGADAKPAAIIYNKLTIDVTQPSMAKTVETINNNLVGVPSSDPISGGALRSAGGQQTLLDRRAYLARYAAVRSVPQLISGWRMPGGGSGELAEMVKKLRQDAGVTADLSDNPSYKEIMHAIAIDRFNSGKYAAGMITDESSVEMEKLTLDAFYLMQLRDYYELLERTALTLAVQVSMLAEQRLQPDPQSAVPVR